MARSLGSRIIIRFLVFLLLFLTWYDLSLHFTRETVTRISGAIPVFPAVQIEMLKSEDPGLKEDALEETAAALLRYIAPSLRQEPWQAYHLFVNLLGSQEPEAVIALSLMPDCGILAVLQKQAGQYVLLYYRDDLLPVTRLEKGFPLENREVFVTREDHDERMGAYSESRHLKIWGWQGSSLVCLWKELLYCDLRWPGSMGSVEDYSVDQGWHQLIQDVTVTYEPFPGPTIVVKGRQFHHHAPSFGSTLPEPPDFTVVSEREIEEIYRWDKEWQYFIVATGLLETDKNGGRQKVAVLKDLAKHIDSLIGKEESYLVRNQNGKEFKADKTKIRLE